MDNFKFYISVGVQKNNEDWTEARTFSAGMDQSQAVILQQVMTPVIQDALTKMGAAAAMAKDEEFMKKLAQMQAVLGQK